MKNALSVIAACSLRVAAAAAYLLTFVEERKIIMSCQQVELNHSICVWELAEPEARRTRNPSSLFENNRSKKLISLLCRQTVDVSNRRYKQ